MYNYHEEKPNLMTASGMDMLLKIRDNAKQLLKSAGCFRAQEAWSGVTGSSWTMLACLDFLVERGEIREVPQNSAAGQHRIFTSSI